LLQYYHAFDPKKQILRFFMRNISVWLPFLLFYTYFCYSIHTLTCWLEALRIM
jgi:hypothetical protein